MHYQSLLDFLETEKAIKLTKDHFEGCLARELNLRRVTAPLFVEAGTGINNDLNGIEKPVSFIIRNMNHTKAEIVQSLAKWKRLALANLKIKEGDGLYTDMNAIRPDEILDDLHSVYVDQWDWEKVLAPEQRNLKFLRKTVEKIFEAMKKTENFLHSSFPRLKPVLPENITFLHTEELEDQYPDLLPQEREHAVCQKLKAVFLLGIGGPLKNGKPHDKRAPDYDDWTSPTEKGKGLNGDILLWNPQLDRAFEISSMGIRVNASALEKQLQIAGTIERKKLFFHKKILNGELPLSIGGGIGQSRLCMFFLKKIHIGEVQASIWPGTILEECRRNNIPLL